MTLEAFCVAVVDLRRRHHASVTSWGRSDKRALAVGGFIGDPHTFDLGVDFVYDVKPPLPALQDEARALGLKVIREVSHDHFQPLDMPAGALTVYDQIHKTWT